MKNTVLFLVVFALLPGCIARDPNFRRRQAQFELEEEQFVEQREKRFEEPRRQRRRRRRVELSGLYVGAGLGRSEVIDLCDDIPSCDDRGKGKKLFGGVELYEHFNLELSYIDLGEIGVSGDLLISDGFGNLFLVPVSVTAEATGFSLAGIGLIPLQGDVFFLTAKAGLFRWDVSAKVSSLGASESLGSDNGIDLMYGVGGIARFSQQFGLRGEWEKFTSVSGSDVELLSLSGMFFF